MNSEQLELDLLLKYRQEFIQLFSNYYPIPEDLIRKYSDCWNWKLLSGNKFIKWNK